MASLVIPLNQLPGDDVSASLTYQTSVSEASKNSGPDSDTRKKAGKGLVLPNTSSKSQDDVSASVGQPLDDDGAINALEEFHRQRKTEGQVLIVCGNLGVRVERIQSQQQFQVFVRGEECRECLVDLQVGWIHHRSDYVHRDHL